VSLHGRLHLVFKFLFLGSRVRHPMPMIVPKSMFGQMSSAWAMPVA